MGVRSRRGIEAMGVRSRRGIEAMGVRSHSGLCAREAQGTASHDTRLRRPRLPAGAKRSPSRGTPAVVVTGGVHPCTTSTRRIPMTDHFEAAEARDGLLSSVTGKAKEVAGAVLGNNSLTREGQLQQAEAAERKKANAEHAVAEAKATEAARQLEAENEAARTAAAAAAADEQRGVRAAEQAKNRQVAEASAKARAEKDEAAAVAEQHTNAVVRDAAADAAKQAQQAKEQNAAAQREHNRLLAEARAAEGNATRDRRDAERLAAEVRD